MFCKGFLFILSIYLYFILLLYSVFLDGSKGFNLEDALGGKSH